MMGDCVSLVSWLRLNKPLQLPNALLAFTAAASHNPFIVEQLLIASIQAVEDAYGVTATPTLNLNRTMNPR